MRAVVNSARKDAGATVAFSNGPTYSANELIRAGDFNQTFEQLGRIMTTVAAEIGDSLGSFLISTIEAENAMFRLGQALETPPIFTVPTDRRAICLSGEICSEFETKSLDSWELSSVDWCGEAVVEVENPAPQYRRAISLE